MAVNQAKEESKERHIKAFINRPMSVAKGYIQSLSIAPTSKTTSVAVLSLKNSNTWRGRDFINKLLEMYNINANNDKNEVAQKPQNSSTNVSALFPRNLEVQNKTWRTSSVALELQI